VSSVRKAAVAGSFYPGEAAVLAQSVDAMLDEAPAQRLHPKALVVPHAGHVYSGPIAASAYKLLVGRPVRKVVLVGPAHFVAVPGLALPAADAVETPLGTIRIDEALAAKVLELPYVKRSEPAHQREHSLEVQLPFLQRVLSGFELIPFAVGDATHSEVAEVLDDLWGGPDTLVVVSSDLSHYYDYESAARLDAGTAAAIEGLHPERLGPESACGRIPIGGLLLAAARHGLHATRLDLRSSGDTAGPRDEVVGYGAFAFC